MDGTVHGGVAAASDLDRIMKMVIISAEPGSVGERVLEYLTKLTGSRKYYCTFGEWHFDITSKLKECHGVIGTKGDAKAFAITLIIGVPGDIVLKEIPYSSQWHPEEAGRKYQVHVGKNVPPGVIRNIAQQIISWIARSGSASPRHHGGCRRQKSGIAQWSGRQRHSKPSYFAHQ